MTLRAFWPAALLALVACASSPPPSQPDNAPAPLIQSEEAFSAFDQAPVLEKWVEPDYPAYAKEHSIAGNVSVQVTVSAKGKVEDARVLESTDRMFDEPALAAARQFRFKPALKDGQPVRAVVMVPVQFRP
jgi:protein TonB